MAEFFLGDTKVTRIGNSRCIPLSAFLAKMQGVNVGDPVTFWIVDNELVLRFPDKIRDELPKQTVKGL